MTCSRCGLEIEAGEMAWNMRLVAQHAKCDVCASLLKERIAALEAENAALRSREAELLAANVALKARADNAIDENAALREDKARLVEALERCEAHFGDPAKGALIGIRAALDAARKGGACPPRET